MENLTKQTILSLQIKRHDIIVINTLYQYEFPDEGYVGLDLGNDNPCPVVKIRFLPKLVSPEIMIKGKFQGSNTSTNDGFQDLYTITAIPRIGWNEVILNLTEPYRYIRYYGQPGSHCQISKLELYTSTKDHHSNQGELQKLTGLPFAALPETRESNYKSVFEEGPDVYLTFKGFSTQTDLPFYIESDFGPSSFYHQHDFYEFMYVKSGSCFHFYQNGIILLCPGDFLIIPPDTKHRVFGGSNLSLKNILVYPDRFPGSLRRHLEELPGFARIFHLVPRLQTCAGEKDRFHVYINDQKLLAPLLDNLEHDFLLQPVHYKVTCMALFLQLFALLSQCLQYSSPERTGEPNSLRHKSVVEAINYLQENYATISNVMDIHQPLGISYSWLAHIFKEETGLSLNDYLIRIRIAQCCRQLLETKDEITTIAYRLGFASYSNFGRTFKQLTGFSPLDFRNFIASNQ